jgi:hypothetical protein
MTHAYQKMMKNVLSSDPRDEDLLITLCENLQWGIDINHASGYVKVIKPTKQTYHFKNVKEAVGWFRMSGAMKKASS